MCPFLLHAPGTLLAPVKRCVLGPLRAQAAEGRVDLTLPARDAQSQLANSATAVEREPTHSEGGAVDLTFRAGGRVAVRGAATGRGGVAVWQPTYRRHDAMA
jgi:D-alanyl-D-alanine dipeptidase